MSLPSSPQPSQVDYLAVGKLHRPHGLHGEIIMEVLTDFPERLTVGITLYVGSAHTPMRLKKVRWQNRGMLVTFYGITTPEAAGELRNQIIYVTAADRPALPEGEYYHHQIIGMQVINQQGESLGEIIDILETGANDVFIIRPHNGREILIPNIDDVVLNIDLEKGQMTVQLLPGLLPEESV